MKRYLWLALFLTACASQSNYVRPWDNWAATTPPPLDFPIIDAHAHFDHPEHHNEQPAPEMVKAFKEANIKGAVIHYHEGEAAATKLDRKNAPFKMATCAGLVPGTTVRHVDEGIQKGQYQCIKVFLGYVGKWAMDPFYQPFYKLAVKRNVPVVFHTGDTYSTKKDPIFIKYTDPLQVDEVAVLNPNVKFVIAHMGSPWIESAAEVVYKNPNVYTDLSAFVLGDCSTLPPEEAYEIIVRPIHWFFIFAANPKKIMFGSDWPLLKIPPYIQAVQRAIPKEHWKAVFHDNAAELFNLN